MINSLLLKLTRELVFILLDTVCVLTPKNSAHLFIESKVLNAKPSWSLSSI